MTVFRDRVTSLDKAFEIANMQGETAGLQLALASRELLIADLTVDIETLLAQIRQEEEEAKRDERTE